MKRLTERTNRLAARVAELEQEKCDTEERPCTVFICGASRNAAGELVVEPRDRIMIAGEEFTRQAGEDDDDFVARARRVAGIGDREVLIL